MSIRSKENEIFYLSCVLCDCVTELENLIVEEVDTQRKILYHPQTQYLFKVRDRLSKVLLVTENKTPSY